MKPFNRNSKEANYLYFRLPYACCNFLTNLFLCPFPSSSESSCVFDSYLLHVKVGVVSKKKHVCRFTDCSNLTSTVLKVDLNLIITNLLSRLLHKYPSQFPMRIGKLCHRTIIWRISNDMIMNCLLNNNMRFSLIVIR